MVCGVGSVPVVAVVIVVGVCPIANVEIRNIYGPCNSRVIVVADALKL